MARSNSGGSAFMPFASIMRDPLKFFAVISHICSGDFLTMASVIFATRAISFIMHADHVRAARVQQRQLRPCLPLFDRRQVSVNPINDFLDVPSRIG